MKKTYIIPSVVSVRLDSRSALLEASIATDDVDIEQGGSTGGGGITDADVKGGRSVWSEER